MRWLIVFLILGIGCSNSATVAEPPDLGMGPQPQEPPLSTDLGVPTGAFRPPRGGPWMPPPA
ncbi:MAG: hypothetical protein ACXWJH_07055, partial [Hyphomicrobium sp.]